LIKFVQRVYDLSSPQGMGFIHFTSEPLSVEEAKEIIDSFNDDKSVAVSLDYIKGRSCKMHVFRADSTTGEKLQIHDNWYDHTDQQLKDLLSSTGVSIKNDPTCEHSFSCNCNDCIIKRSGRRL
jgi:hypothetical protein